MFSSNNLDVELGSALLQKPGCCRSFANFSLRPTTHPGDLFDERTMEKFPRLHRISVYSVDVSHVTNDDR